MEVLIINNYKGKIGLKRTRKIKELFLKCGFRDFKILNFEKVREEHIKRSELVVLSGYESGCIGDYLELSKKVRKAKRAIGICGGMYIIALAFHVLPKSLPKRRKGFNKIEFKKRTFLVYHNHILYLPEERLKKFEILGRSRFLRIKIPEIIRKNKFIGLQFHPELSGADGLNIIKEILFYYLKT